MLVFDLIAFHLSAEPEDLTGSVHWIGQPVDFSSSKLRLGCAMNGKNGTLAAKKNYREKHYDESMGAKATGDSSYGINECVDRLQRDQYFIT